MFSMFDELKQSQEINYDYIKTWSTFKKMIRLNRFQEPYNEKSFKKNVWRVFKKQRCIYNPCEHLRWSFSVNILNGFIFSQYKLHHRSSTGLYIGLWKYWDFQSEAKAEQIIAIVTTHSVSCLLLIFKQILDYTFFLI